MFDPEPVCLFGSVTMAPSTGLQETCRRRCRAAPGMRDRCILHSWAKEGGKKPKKGEGDGINQDRPRLRAEDYSNINQSRL